MVLDAGHGGKDPGTWAPGAKDHREARRPQRPKLVGKYIQEAFPDVKVVYTRDDDTFHGAAERCEIANRNKADIFISVHCNARRQTCSHGSETTSWACTRPEANMRGGPEGERGHPAGGRARPSI